MYLRPVLLMETFLYWRLFHYYFNLISEACCHAKFICQTHTFQGFFAGTDNEFTQCAYNGD